MDIAHLITYIDNQAGGMERQALQLAQQLRDNNHNIFFITCTPISKLRNKINLKGNLNGFLIYRIPIISGWRLPNAFVYLMGGITCLLILKRKYSIIHAHQLYTSGLVACIVKILLPSKKVVIKNCAGSLYGDVVNLKRMPFSNWIIKFMNRMADIVVCVSPEVERETKEAGFSHVTMIPNGVDTEKFIPVSRQSKEELKEKILKADKDKKVALFVGRLGPEKNISVLLQSLALLDNEVLLLIAGEGDIRMELQAQVNKERLVNKVIFLGAVENVHEFYQIADVFILPSKSEGLPNVLLEAMSSGLPCIGSDIPSIRSVITNKHNGYLFSCNDPIGLARAVNEILTDNRLSIMFSENARKKVVNQYAFKDIAARYADLYTSLTKNYERICIG